MEAKDKAKLLAELGLEKASERLLRKHDGKRKILSAINEYRYATQDDIDDFNKEIQKCGKRLVFTELKSYENLPPDDVLDALRKAKEKDCFDSFDVAHIEMVKDPILFGRIKDFKNLYFYIAQWGDDVRIEDILKFEQEEVLSIRTLTNPEPPEQFSDTEYGRVTNKEWCELELKRIDRPHYFIHQDVENGYICIKYRPTAEEALLKPGW